MRKCNILKFDVSVLICISTYLQCFSTGGLQHTSVPWNLFRCDAKIIKYPWNCLNSIQFMSFFTLKCAAELFIPHQCAASSKRLRTIEISWKVFFCLFRACFSVSFKFCFSLYCIRIRQGFHTSDQRYARKLSVVFLRTVPYFFQ